MGMKETPEQIAQFAAEMMQLAKRPEMRPYLTSTELKRQEKEEKRDEEADEKRKEEWIIEQSRRYKAIADWTREQMTAMAPVEFEEFQTNALLNKNKALKALRKKGWVIHARATKVTKPGHYPVAATNCLILFQNQIQAETRFIWEEPQPIKSLIIQPGA